MMTGLQSMKFAVFILFLCFTQVESQNVTCVNTTTTPPPGRCEESFNRGVWLFTSVGVNIFFLIIIIGLICYRFGSCCADTKTQIRENGDIVTTTDQRNHPSRGNNPPQQARRRPLQRIARQVRTSVTQFNIRNGRVPHNIQTPRPAHQPRAFDAAQGARTGNTANRPVGHLTTNPSAANPTVGQSTSSLNSNQAATVVQTTASGSGAKATQTTSTAVQCNVPCDSSTQTTPEELNSSGSQTTPPVTPPEKAKGDGFKSSQTDLKVPTSPLITPQPSKTSINQENGSHNGGNMTEQSPQQHHQVPESGGGSEAMQAPPKPHHFPAPKGKAQRSNGVSSKQKPAPPPPLSPLQNSNNSHSGSQSNIQTAFFPPTQNTFQEGSPYENELNNGKSGRPPSQGYITPVDMDDTRSEHIYDEIENDKDDYRIMRQKELSLKA